MEVDHIAHHAGERRVLRAACGSADDCRTNQRGDEARELTRLEVEAHVGSHDQRLAHRPILQLPIEPGDGRERIEQLRQTFAGFPLSNGTGDVIRERHRAAGRDRVRRVEEAQPVEIIQRGCVRVDQFGQVEVRRSQHTRGDLTLLGGENLIRVLLVQVDLLNRHISPIALHGDIHDRHVLRRGGDTERPLLRGVADRAERVVHDLTRLTVRAVVDSSDCTPNGGAVGSRTVVNEAHRRVQGGVVGELHTGHDAVDAGLDDRDVAATGEEAVSVWYAESCHRNPSLVTLAVPARAELNIHLRCATGPCHGSGAFRPIECAPHPPQQLRTVLLELHQIPGRARGLT